MRAQGSAASYKRRIRRVGCICAFGLAPRVVGAALQWFSRCCLFAVRMGFDDREIVARAFHRCALRQQRLSNRMGNSMGNVCAMAWTYGRRRDGRGAGKERGKGCGLRGSVLAWQRSGMVCGRWRYAVYGSVLRARMVLRGTEVHSAHAFCIRCAPPAHRWGIYMQRSPVMRRIK